MSAACGDRLRSSEPAHYIATHTSARPCLSDGSRCDIDPYVPARSLRSADQNLLNATISNVMGVVLSRLLDHPYGTPCQVLLGTLFLYVPAFRSSIKTHLFAKRLSLCFRSLVFQDVVY